MPKRNLKAEFEAVIAKTVSGDVEALVRFLDSINSLGDLVELKSLAELPELKKLHAAKYLERGDLFNYYEQNLKKWSDPKLSEHFKEQYPMVTERLDTPEKIRVFLRGADFFHDVTPEKMGEAFEDILRRHYLGGEQKVAYLDIRDGDVKHIVYYTQLPAWTLVDILLPGVKSRSISSDEGLSIDWRTKAEREAAGERY